MFEQSSAYRVRFLWLAFLAQAAIAAQIRVDGNSGTNSPGCGSVSTPCRSIQHAVNLSSSDDVILVASGVYTYQGSLDPCTSETAVVCIEGKELTILGGFDGVDWSTRDPAANPTVIDGQDFQRGVLVRKTFPGAPNEASLQMEGFTIKRGVAGGTPSAQEDKRGGGLKAGLVRSIVLKDIVFEDNVAQGDDTAVGDGGNGSGGALSISTSGGLPPVKATLSRVTLSRNQALGGEGPERGGLALGGGLFANRTDLTASELLVDSNSVQAGSSPGPGLLGPLRADALGGGIALLSETTGIIDKLTATGNSVVGGSSAGEGGVGGGGGLYVEGSSLIVTNSEIRNNTTLGGSGDSGGIGTGGGFTAFDADVLLEQVSLISNHATGGAGTTKKGTVGGGGAYLQRAFDPSVSSALVNCIVADNRVTLGSGGGTVGGGGAGIFVLGNDAAIVHTTFARNILDSDPMKGQAISVVPRAGAPSHADIEHVIVADHTSLTNVPAVQVRTGASATFNGALFAGNDRDTNYGALDSGIYAGLETTTTAGSAGFMSPGPPDFDYHVTGTSPAIDSAIGSLIVTDLDETVRGSAKDLGADEYCSAVDEDLVLPPQTATGSMLEVACRTITASDYTIESTGDVIFQAGAAVILHNGLSIAVGGSFEVTIEVP